MSNFSAWFRQLGNRLMISLRHFFTGRYCQPDKLNMAILCAGMIMILVSMFVRNVLVDLVLTVGSYAMVIWSMARYLSRNTYKRYQENRRFLLLMDQLRDRSNRYFSCPKCRQTVRVPRGKGKIAITCPKCREKFIKKT